MSKYTRELTKLGVEADKEIGTLRTNIQSQNEDIAKQNETIALLNDQLDAKSLANAHLVEENSQLKIELQNYRK